MKARAVLSILFFVPAFLLSMSFVYPYPPIGSFHIAELKPIISITALNLGLRKVGADLLFIDLLQYYGTPEIPQGAKVHVHDDGHGHKHIHYEGEPEFGYGNYPLFYSYAREILFLDPYFKNAVLYSCGALAFNLKRIDEAAALLKTAMLYSSDPQYYKMLAALAAKNSKNRKDLASILYEIAMKPETPVLIKNSAAWANKQSGSIDRANEIYRLILKTTKDQYYIGIAKKNLGE